jgi:CRP/FNR family transcriptional regulator, cyclic AMP receptor protein
MLIDYATVQRFGCFQSLNADQLAAFASELEDVRLSAGKVLFNQGDPGDSIYLLVSGEITIKLCSPSPDDHTLAKLGDGAILGEMGPLLNAARTATAIAATESHLWRISASAFHEALRRGEAWATGFLLATAQVLGKRVLILNEELVRLSEKLHHNVAQPQIRKAVAEIEELRKRLATEWQF